MLHDFTIKKNIHVLFPIAMFDDTEGYIRVYPIKCRDILVMVDMVVSINGGTPSHHPNFNRMFHSKPSIWG